MRILVVDDDYASRLKLKVLLGPYGDVDGASDGEQALLMFSKAHDEGIPYKLITMDIGLPDMAGQEVVREIREYEDHHRRHLADSIAKILMVSVKEDAKNVVSSFRWGCEGYLVKPVTEEKLDGTLKAVELLKAR